jgi:hypothetical protein
MSPVVLVGMAVGTLAILTALAVCWSKKAFPMGSIGVMVIGLVLIGMSQWNSITLEATAAAAAVVAHEAQNNAAAVEVTRRQLATLTTQLETRSLSPQSATAIRSAIEAAPRADTNRLRVATTELKNLPRVPVRRTRP